MFWIIFLLTASGCLADESSVSMAVVHRLTKKFEGLISTGEYIDKFAVKTKLECAKICAGKCQCKSLFYVNDVKLCKTHAQLFVPESSELTPNQSALYYEKEDTGETDSSNGQTLTTTSSVPFTCPSGDSSFTPATLSDGTQFSFRVFIDEARTFDDANAKCGQFGSTLYEVITIPKFSFTQQLMTCNAYSLLNFWTNGVYNSSTNSWETLTGRPIPMTSDFWYPNRPNSYGSSTCVWMQATKDHFFDDYLCNPQIPTFTICEKL